MQKKITEKTEAKETSLNDSQEKPEIFQRQQQNVAGDRFKFNLFFLFNGKHAGADHWGVEFSQFPQLYWDHICL